MRSTDSGDDVSPEPLPENTTWALRRSELKPFPRFDPGQGIEAKPVEYFAVSYQDMIVWYLEAK